MSNWAETMIMMGLSSKNAHLKDAVLNAPLLADQRFVVWMLHANMWV